MKKILCALLILSMLIIPAACQRTQTPEGESAVTQNGTAPSGWSPSDDENIPGGEGQGENAAPDEGENGEGAPDPGYQPEYEIPVVTEATPDKAVKSISIKTTPATSVYYAGSPIDTKGLTVNVKFTDGTEKTIAGGFGYSPTVAKGSGTQKITVSYGGRTDTFIIKVRDDALKGISIKSKPNRLTYGANEKIDIRGLVINAQYESGTVRAVSDGFSISPDSFSAAGTHNVTVSYGGKTATFPVTVRSGKSAMISTIRVTSKPTRISYYLNEKLDTKGMVLTVNYTDGTSENLTSGFKCTPVNLNEKGVQKIIVTYQNKSTAFNVTVKEDTVKSIEIKQGPKKINYYQGDVLETEGLELTVDYENAPSKTISSGFACSPTLLKDAGLQTITVSYAGRKKTFTVRVKEDTLQSIEILTGPVKRNYYVGDSLDTKGLTVRAVYLSGRAVALTASDVTCTPGTFTSEGASVPVAVSYGGKTVHFGVKVTANPIKEIFVSQLPKKKYTVGDTVSKSDIVVSAKRENGKTETITGFTLHNAELNKVGSNTIKVTYGDYIAYFSVNAENTVSGIRISSEPDKTTYKVGESLDTAGMKIVAVYANGDEKEIPVSSCSVSPTVFNNETNSQRVNVIYSNNISTYFFVKVEK